MKLNYFRDKGLVIGFEGGNIIRPESNYTALINKPTINGVELTGDMSGADFNLGSIYYGTTAEWEAQTDLVPAQGSIYIYSDYAVGAEQSIPGIKVGDGESLLSELAFATGGSSDLPAGNAGDILTSTGTGISWVAPANDFDGDNTRPMTAAGVYTQIGNINALLATI